MHNMLRKPNAPSGGGDRRKRRRTQTAQRILKTALRLFAERGYANTTIEAITEATDIGKGTFFNYFPTKEDLVIAFGELQVAKVVAAASSKTANTSIRDLITDMVKSIVSEWQGNQRLLRAMFGAMLSNENLSLKFAELLALGRRNVALLFEEGQRRGEIRRDIPPLILARMLQQTMLGAQLVWSSHSDLDLVKWIEQSVALLWSGSDAAGRALSVPAKRKPK
jgi:AcrR family transcriptional regulator